MTNHIVLQKGFRPFFLLGGAAAVALVPWWAVTYQKPMTGEPGLESISWHSHEMIFGFSMAIIAGFLLTAVENWTSRPTARGPFLAALVGLWCVGRLVGLGGVPATIGGMADLCFIPTLAIAVAIPLFLARSKRNYLLLAVLPLLWACDAVLHLRTSGLLPQSYLRTDLVAVDLVVVVLVIITGRIVPLFTRNALGNDRIRMNAGLNTAAICSVLLVAVVELFASSGLIMAAVAGVSGLLVIARSLHWGASKTLAQPILDRCRPPPQSSVRCDAGSTPERGDARAHGRSHRHPCPGDDGQSNPRSHGKAFAGLVADGIWFCLDHRQRAFAGPRTLAAGRSHQTCPRRLGRVLVVGLCDLSRGERRRPAHPPP
jgi:uncharacterized protein involved in response to NO